MMKAKRFSKGRERVRTVALSLGEDGGETDVVTHHKFERVWKIEATRLAKLFQD